MNILYEPINNISYSKLTFDDVRQIFYMTYMKHFLSWPSMKAGWSRRKDENKEQRKIQLTIEVTKLIQIARITAWHKKTVVLEVSPKPKLMPVRNRLTADTAIPNIIE